LNLACEELMKADKPSTTRWLTLVQTFATHYVTLIPS
jgi:hypothetical protein